MTLPRRGSRSIVVRGRTWRWYIRHKPTYWQEVFLDPMTVAIESAEPEVRGLLLVELDVCRPDHLIWPDHAPVTPAHIRRIIESAPDAGWVPEEGGRLVFAWSYRFNRPH